MIPSDTRDLIFAGAGILWGVVVVFRGMKAWYVEKNISSFPVVIALGTALAVSCIGYLVHRL